MTTTGFTSHFRSWLSANGYAAYNLVRDDLVGGSYGGKASGTDTVVNQPVIFIHGNSDKAIGTGSAGQSGWNASLDYFLTHGYKTSELYATTWGPADASLSAYQYHSKTNVMKVRKFIEAVKAYTGAAKVDIVTHSMGVTLARKAILGGYATDSLEGGQYYIGPSLTSSVDTFVGIAGANLGLCRATRRAPPRPPAAHQRPVPGRIQRHRRERPLGVPQRPDVQQRLRGRLPLHHLVHGGRSHRLRGRGVRSYTSRIPSQTGEKVYSGYPYGHFGLKDQTPSVQLSMVKSHVIP